MPACGNLPRYPQSPLPHLIWFTDARHQWEAESYPRCPSCGPSGFLFFLINLFIFGCFGSSFLCEGFLQLWRAGATPHRGARVSHCRGLSRCGAQAPDAQAQYLWLTGLVAPWHVGSSQTRARTCVPCIGRQILNHCATREAPFRIS